MSQTINTNATEKLPAKVKFFAASAALGGFLFGFDASVINGANTGFQETFHLSAAQAGASSAIALLGSAAGAFFAGKFSDKYGRRNTMLVAAAMFFISALGTGFAHTNGALEIWRVIGGIGIGIASVIAPGYISEIAPAKFRGRLASLQQMMITIGIFTVLLTNAMFASAAHGDAAGIIGGLEAWRWMFLLGVVPAIIYGALAWKLPESPRFYLLNGQVDQAKDVLDQVNEGNTAESNRQIESIMADIKNDQSAPALGDLFKNKIVWLGIALAGFQQLVGINVIMYYSTNLFQQAGFNNPFWISFLVGLVNMGTTVIAIMLVDKWGRKKLLLAGAAGMAITQAMVAIAFTNADSAGTITSSGFKFLAAAGVLLYIVSFAISWGPIVWVLLGEMFNNKIRAVAIGIGGVSNWLVNYLISVTFPVMREWNAVATFFIYAAFAVIGGILVYFLVPETKGKELEEINFDNPRGFGDEAPQKVQAH
ncbi:MAG: sugar porter family MFS transporter [Micrococcaceae bacterium]